MSSETTTTSERDEQLRRLLVATSTAEAVKAPKKSRTLIVSIVAFAVARAVTGGAISAAALSNDQPSMPTSISIEDMTEQVVRDDTQLFGTPFIIRSVGVTDIHLGRAPAGATSIALVFHCVSGRVINVPPLCVERIARDSQTILCGLSYLQGLALECAGPRADPLTDRPGERFDRPRQR